MKKIDLIINTDPGHDDAMAIMLAERSKRFNILALTTVAGNSTIENTTRNARYILGLLGRDDIPVYSGSGRPLKRKLIQAAVHGKSGLEGIDPKNPPMLNGESVDRIIEIVDSRPGKVRIATLGPLTDIAKAIKKSPSIMKKVKDIVIMGGAIRVPGNMSRVAEFNFFVDPEAADIVMQFPVKKTLVPLDPCNSIGLTLRDFSSIKDAVLRNALLRMAEPYIRNLYKEGGDTVALMYDPLTIYCMLNPKAVKTYQCNVMVETKGELTYGMSVADLRRVTDAKPNVEVVESISREAFRRDFVTYLSGNSMLR